MLHYRKCDYRLLIVFTVFILVVTGQFDYERQPVGPEMCKDHCRQCNERTFCIFLIRRLTCVVTWSKYPPQTNGDKAVYLDISKDRPRSILQRKELCAERRSRTVVTRSNGIRCVKLGTEKKRLLLVPFMEKRKKPVRAFDPLDSSMTTYHHVKPQCVTAAVYVPSLQKVLISSYRPRAIQAFSLPTDVSVTVQRGLCVVSTAVDDADHLVFLATNLPFACVCSMTPDGRHFKKILCQIRPYSLCLDTTRDILYVADFGSIYSFTYEGEEQQRIASADKVLGMTLGDTGDVIYYSHGIGIGIGIMELELFKNGTGRRVTGLMNSTHINALLCNDGSLYISSRKMYIYVWRKPNLSLLKNPDGTSVRKQLITFL